MWAFQSLGEFVLVRLTIAPANRPLEPDNAQNQPSGAANAQNLDIECSALAEPRHDPTPTHDTPD